MKNIIVLISGNGSNLQAIINACNTKKINGNVIAVFSNKINAPGISRAKEANIPVYILMVEQFINYEAFYSKLIQKIDSFTPDLVVLAGYMQILKPLFVTHYKGRLLNIHPSLLPKYPGLYTHRRVLNNGDKEHGASVHFVTNEIDKGPIIIQAKVPVFSNDNEKSIATRVLQQEHIIYPLAISWFIDNRLIMHNNTVWLDGVELPVYGILLH